METDMKRLVSTVLAIAMLSTPALAEGYVGAWSSTKEAKTRCGDEDDGKVVLRRNSIQGYEHSCQFKASRIDFNTWQFIGTCEGEGETYSLKSTATVAGGRNYPRPRQRGSG